MENLIYQALRPDFEVIRRKLINNKKNNENNFNLDKSELFRPFVINNLSFKNHFAFINLTDNEFYENEIFNFGKYYENIAKTGVGLIVTGGVDLKLINKKINIYDDKDLLLIRDEINKIHSFGTKIFMQIKQFYGRGIDANKYLNRYNYSASFNKSFTNSLISMRISDFKCNKIINEIKNICEYARKVEFDGVLINGDLFNILGELNSCEFNRRYFGCYAQDGEFTIKMLNALKNDFKKYNIFYSITVESFLKEIYGNQLKNIVTTFKSNNKSNFNLICKNIAKMVKYGVDGFIFNFGTYENEFLSTHNEFQAEYIFYEYYKELKEFFKNNNIKNKFGDNVIIIYKDNINSLNTAESIFEKGLFDFLDITKQLYADNNYLNNLLDLKQSKPCIKCGYCNHVACLYGKNLCMINPENFILNNDFNDKYSCKNIAIIGAGLSGIMCANYLLDKRYHIDIFDKSDKINKKRRNFEVFDFCDLNKNFNNYIEDNLIKNANLCQIHLKTDINASNILKNQQYDAIIIATGSDEKLLNIKGSILKSVVSLNEILSKVQIIEKFDKIVIMANGELSLKFALYLLNLNKKVTIIITNFDCIKNISNDRFTYYFSELANLNADIYIDSKIKMIEHEFVELIINKNMNKQNLLSTIMNMKLNLKSKRQEKLISIDYDIFIYEPELYENNKLYYEILSSGYKGDLFMIGNSLKISCDADCIKSAYFVAKKL